MTDPALCPNSEPASDVSECELSSWDSTSASPQIVLAAEEAKAFIKKHNQVAAAAKAAAVPPSEPKPLDPEEQAAVQAHLEQCRIYVGNLDYTLSEGDIRSTFESFGPIESIDFPRDPAGRMRGYGFIVFARPEHASAAIEGMQGFSIMGRVLKVARPTSSATGGPQPDPMPAAVDPSLVADVVKTGVSGAAAVAQRINARLGASSVSPAIPAPLPNTIPVVPGKPVIRVYVGALNFDLTAADVEALFEGFGKIAKVSLIPHPETGKHRGYGFVDFCEQHAADLAIAGLNGVEVAGRALKVALAKPAGGAAVTPVGPVAAVQPGVVPSTASTVNTSVSQDQGSSNAPRGPLMQKLLRSNNPPSRCLALCNMVGPDEVDDELKGEVQGECEQHGQVERVVVHVAHGEVTVFVLFAAQEAAGKAANALDNRWFGGRIVRALYYDEQRFTNNDLA